MFKVPVKVLKEKSHIPVWEKSEAYAKLISFIKTVGDAVKATPISERKEPSKGVSKFLTVLNEVDKLIDETPPVEMTMRFGNPAFRDFHAKLVENAEEILSHSVDGAHKPALKELKPYFLDSFGNATRIDYGSGHELAFVALLCCFGLMKIFHEQDTASICLHIFKRYLEIVRRLQTTYKLEPAGSHGVWGLDDYQFLCYYWGASQLIGQAQFTPKMIPEKEKALQAADDYIFFDAIKFIFETKTGPFFEHSKYLFDISGVPSWSKVHSGLLKMYKAEVLNKLPIVQHFMFGYLLPIDESLLSPAMEKELEMKHDANAFGKTWGGPVPSHNTSSSVTAVDPSQVNSNTSSMPMTSFPTPGTKPIDVDNQPTIAMRTGGARVAERGSFAKK